MTVQLIQSGGALGVLPWVPSLAAPLTCMRRETTRERWEIVYKINPIPMYLVLDSGAGVTYAGLLSKVKKALDLEGIQYEVVHTPLPAPTLPIPDDIEFRPNQKEVLEAIGRSEMGIVKLPTSWGKTFLIEILCRMYAGFRVLVVTTRISVLTSIRDRIKARCPDRKVEILGKGKTVVGALADTLVCSSGSLHHVDPDWPQLLLFDEVHHAGAPLVFHKLGRFSSTRRFGFSATPFDRIDNTAVLVEAIFGPVIADIPYDDATMTGTVTPLHVVTIPVVSPFIEKKTTLSMDRHNIWRNFTRNKIIAECAHQFQDEQVLIMVSTIEHALYLRRHLPEFTIVRGGLSEERRNELIDWGLIKDDEPRELDVKALYQQFRNQELRKVIATTMWSEGMDFPALRVLIRADGATGALPSIQIGGRLGRIHEGKDEGILVDFMDKIGSRYEKRSSKRLKVYRREKWKVTQLVRPEELKGL